MYERKVCIISKFQVMKKVNGQETSDDVPHVGTSYTVVETTKTFNPLPGTIVRIGGIDGKLLTVYCAADPSIEYKVPIRTFKRCCSQGRKI